MSAADKAVDFVSMIYRPQLRDSHSLLQILQSHSLFEDVCSLNNLNMIIYHNIFV